MVVRSRAGSCHWLGSSPSMSFCLRRLSEAALLASRRSSWQTDPHVCGAHATRGARSVLPGAAIVRPAAERLRQPSFGPSAWYSARPASLAAASMQQSVRLGGFGALHERHRACIRPFGTPWPPNDDRYWTRPCAGAKAYLCVAFRERLDLSSGAPCSGRSVGELHVCLDGASIGRISGDRRRTIGRPPNGSHD